MRVFCLSTAMVTLLDTLAITPFFWYGILKQTKVRRTHHAYIDEFCQRVLSLLQDLPPAVLDDNGNLDPRKIKMVTSYLKETKQALDPEKSVTITVTLPEKGKSLGLAFNSDETYGFPVLTKVSPTSPLRTQIPMDMQRNCWLVAIMVDTSSPSQTSFGWRN